MPWQSEKCPTCCSLDYGCSPSVAIGLPWLCRKPRDDTFPDALADLVQAVEKKNTLLKNDKERMAQVGGSKPPTTGDVCRVMFAAEQCGSLYPQGECDQDVVNLLYGRDFLTEDKTYDVVLVHSIFHTSDYALNIARNQAIFKGQISSQHSTWQWAMRLTNTKARLIIVCDEMPFSLGGFHLGELAGYKIYKRDENITIYVREVPC